MPDRLGHLIANGLERGRRAGIRGAHQGLERSRGFLLNLLERRQGAQGRVEALEGCEAFLGRAPRRTQRISKQRYLTLQILELRRPNDAKLIVGVEYLAKELQLAIGGIDAFSGDRLEGVEILAHLREGGFDLVQFALCEPGVGQIQDQLSRLLELFIESGALASELI